MAVAKFTYAGDPTASPVQEVRFLAGDTDRARAEIDDGEIAYAISKQPDPRMAAALLLDVLANQYARKADTSAGEVKRSLGDRSDTLRKRASDLRLEAGKSAVPFFGGLTKSGKDALAQDTDAVQPHAAIGQFDNPRATQFDDEAPDAVEGGGSP